MKKDASPPSATTNSDEGLGFDNATFRWNEVPVDSDKDDNGKENGKGKARDPITNSDTVGDDASSTVGDRASSVEADFTASEEERCFELKDLNLRFPEGQLTVVTGPTASGKTALLVCAPFQPNSPKFLNMIYFLDGSLRRDDNYIWPTRHAKGTFQRRLQWFHAFHLICRSISLVETPVYSG